MDWELKMPPWDLSELDQPPTGPNMGPIEPGLDCSVDLKLGAGGDFDHHHHLQQQQQQQQQRSPAVVAAATAAAASSSSGGSAKRARQQSGGSQNAACLVDGCKSDLSNYRDYFRKHRVCEDHSKTPIVLVGGQQQRFCQQCSRFHLLVEFDEVKRSCRKRLEGHNRRRRKPQPNSINSGSLFTNHQGNRFSSYPPMYQAAVSDPAWPVIVKSEEESLFNNHHAVQVHFLDRQQQHHHFSNSFPQSFKEGKRFPFLQDSDQAALETSSICQPLLKTISSAESSNNNNHNNTRNKLFANGLSQVLDSDCALSLLSSPPQSSSAINLGQIVSSVDRIPIYQPLISYGGGLELGRYSGASNHVSVSATGFSCSGMEDENNVGGSTTVLVSDASDPEMSCQLFGVVGGGGSSDGGSQALPFSW